MRNPLLDFVGIDFETANDFRASACAMGLTKVVDGKVKESRYFLFRPPPLFEEFNWRQIRIHKITSDLVEGLPRFGEYWPEILEFISGLDLVAHHAPFDISVLKSSLRASNLPVPSLNYACTIVMSRIVYDLNSYRLPIVAKAAGVAWDSNLHHNAEYDSLIAAQITISMARALRVDSLVNLTKELNVSLGYLSADNHGQCSPAFYEAKIDRTPSPQFKSAKEVMIHVEASPFHPLYRRNVVFTGELSTLTRGEAWYETGEFGGTPCDNVTRKTNILVVAQHEFGDFLQGKTPSSKVRYAQKLQTLGMPIEIIGEEEFMGFISWEK